MQDEIKKNLDFKVIDNTSAPGTESCCGDGSCCSGTNDINAIEAEMARPSGEQAEFIVHGMDCPACALTIEKGISALNGISHVRVTYSTAKLRVTTSDAAVLKQIPALAKKLGYRAELLYQNSFESGRLRPKQDQPKGTSSFLMTAFSGAFLASGFIGSYANVPEGFVTILYALSMMIAGYKPARSAFYAVKSRSLDMNVLMSAAALGAALIGQWLEGATVVWLFAIGNILQTHSMERTRNSIRSLMDLAPPEAWVKSGNEWVRRPVEEVSVGDVIVIKPGDKVPLDGEIVQGVSCLNQSPITGESDPVDKGPGDTVYAGTVNENGFLEVKVTKLAEDTTIAKIIHLVEEAQEQKAPTQALVDKFAKIYTPLVFILAILVIGVPPLFEIGAWADWFYKGLELLVVACPCALVISTPVAMVSAIGNAARNGILIKGGAVLETAGSISVIAFDKTGTLTEGKPRVSHITVYEGTEEELLAIARTIEKYSNHPIARAVVERAIEKNIDGKNGDSFKTIVGKGAQASIGGIEYYAGSMKLFEEKGTPVEQAADHAKKLQSEGNTVVLIGTKETIIGMLAVADAVREACAGTLRALKSVGISRTVMLTGDNEGTAQKIASQTGIDRHFSGLLPEDKAEAVKRLQIEGIKVAMVGDGINDAPALATADLGIAMGGAGTDTAMEAADIVLMADHLDKLPHLVMLSRKAKSVIKQNIWFSIVVKLAALGLIFPGWLTLWIAVLSDTGAALIVILNSMRLLRMKR